MRCYWCVIKSFKIFAGIIVNATITKHATSNRILVGCGVIGYGGIYYDPRKDFKRVYDTPLTPHPYSLYTWLKKHPKYIAIGPDGKPYAKSPYSIVACPSRKEN